MAITRNTRGADTVTRITVVGLTLLLLWGELSRVEGGCSSFGHSCFGAHGKRAEVPATYNSDAPMRVAGQQAEGSISDFEPNFVPLSNARLSPYLIDWIMSARRQDSRPAVNEEMSGTYRRK